MADNSGFPMNNRLYWGKRMSDELFGLRWTRPPGGHGFQADHRGDLWLLPGSASQMVEYDPLREETGLFLALAKAPATAERMVEFANRYGDLDSRTPLELWDVYAKARAGVEASERSLNLWRQRVRRLGVAVQVWEALRGGDGDRIAEALAGVAGMSALVEAMGPHAAAAHALTKFLNDALDSGVQARTAKGAAEGSLRLLVEPADLWRAACLQFALAVDGDRKFQACPVCERWFELRPGIGRANKVFCSPTCRTKATGRRREEAVRLHGKGKSLAEIVRATGAKPESVRAWVRAAGKQAKGG
jgi:hypothetical protein